MFERGNDRPGSRRWTRAVAVAATAVAVASLAIVGTVAAQSRQLFDDVPPGHYAFDSIEWAVASGITEGCGTGRNFCPEQTLNRAHMVTFLKRYHDKFGNAASNSPTTTTAATPDEWVLRGFGSRDASPISLTTGSYYVDFTLLRPTAINVAKVVVSVAGPAISSEREVIKIEGDPNNPDTPIPQTIIGGRGSFQVGNRLSQLPPGKIYFTVRVTAPSDNNNSSTATTDWEIVVTER